MHNEQMIKLYIKPMSLNNAYVTNFKTGRRFPSKAYGQYKKDLAMIIPRWKECPNGKLWMQYEFGVSSKMNDVDNLTKGIQDALAEAYGFNDRDVYRVELEKVIVPKGQEYIKFHIQTWTPPKTSKT